MSRSSAVEFKPRNRLAQILSRSGGSDFIDHVARAEKAIGDLAPKMSKGLKAQVETLSNLCLGSEAEVFEACREIGLSGLTLIESARLAGRWDLAEIAEGLWQMIDALTARGIWHTDALKAHVATLRLLSSDAGSPDLSPTLIAELQRLRAAIGVQKPE